MIVRVIDIKNIKDEEIEQIKVQFPIRYQKGLAFTHHEDFLRSVGAMILLLDAFGEFKEEDIYYNEFDKPFIKGKEEFNYSHSGDYVCLVTNKNPIGIDIEKIDENNVRIADKVCSKEEIKWMSSDPITRFHYLWCQKESVMKAVGLGLGLSPNSFTIFPFETNQPVILMEKSWYNFTIKYFDYVISITTTEPIEKISLNRR